MIDSGVVYAASHSGVLAAIDIRTGQRIWARTFASTQTPWVTGAVLYAVSVDGELAAFDRETGNVYWVQQLRRYRNEDESQRPRRLDRPDHGGRRAWCSRTPMGEVVAVSPANGQTVAQRRSRPARVSSHPSPRTVRSIS